MPRASEPARWGGPCTEDPPRPATQASSKGYFLGAYGLPAGTGEELHFPPGLFPLGLFVVSAFSSLWLEEQHVDVQQDWSPGVCPLTTWEIRQPGAFS